MGYFLRPEVLSVVLVLIAWIMEMKLLRSKESRHLKVKVIAIVSLIMISVLIFLNYYTDTLFDALVVFSILMLSFMFLGVTIPMLNSRLKYQHATFFLIHWCVGIFMTGIKSYILIQYPSVLLASYFLFTTTYYLYRSRERLKILLIVGVLISVRFANAYEIDFTSDPMVTRSPDRFMAYQYHTRNKPYKIAVNYLNDNFSKGSIQSMDVICKNPKKNGITYIINYSIDGKKKLIRLKYVNGEIVEE